MSHEYLEAERERAELLARRERCVAQHRLVLARIDREVDRLTKVMIASDDHARV